MKARSPGQHDQIVRVVGKTLPQQIAPRAVGKRALFAGQQRNQIDPLLQRSGAERLAQLVHDREQVVLLQCRARWTQQRRLDDRAHFGEPAIPQLAARDRSDRAFDGFESGDEVRPRQARDRHAHGEHDDAEIVETRRRGRIDAAAHRCRVPTAAATAALAARRTRRLSSPAPTAGVRDCSRCSNASPTGFPRAPDRSNRRHRNGAARR